MFASPSRSAVATTDASTAPSEVRVTLDELGHSLEV
jgi:hypothetical protein